jgi:hypothetical protein
MDFFVRLCIQLSVDIEYSIYILLIKINLDMEVLNVIFWKAEDVDVAEDSR